MQQDLSEIGWGEPDRWIHWSYIPRMVSGYLDEDEEYLPFLEFSMTVFDTVSKRYELIKIYLD